MWRSQISGAKKEQSLAEKWRSFLAGPPESQLPPSMLQELGKPGSSGRGWTAASLTESMEEVLSKHGYTHLSSLDGASSSGSGSRCARVSTSNMPLDDWWVAKKVTCLLHHKDGCGNEMCDWLLPVAARVLNDGSISMREAWELVRPGRPYFSDKARRLFGKVPVMVVLLGPQGRQTQRLLAVGEVGQFASTILNLKTIYGDESTQVQASTKRREMKALLQACSSPGERARLMYSAFLGGGVQSSKALGLRTSRLKEGVERVEEKLTQCKAITTAIQGVIETHSKVMAAAVMGDDVEGEEWEFGFASELRALCEEEGAGVSLDDEAILSGLRQSGLDWTIFLAKLTEKMWRMDDKVDMYLGCFPLQRLANMDEGLDDEELAQVIRSKQVHTLRVVQAVREELHHDRERRSHTDVVSDDEEEVAFADLQSTDFETPSLENRATVASGMARRSLARLGIRRLKSGEGVVPLKGDLLRRKVKRMSKMAISKAGVWRGRKRITLVERQARMEKKMPGVGTAIEEYLTNNCVGADSWRREGVACLVTNERKVGKKVTFASMQAHLKDKYDRHISYGTVVELCQARNKRSLNASRYLNMAQVVSRRARKGFDVKLSANAKWSNALYRFLDVAVEMNGLQTVVIGRDDMTGMRMDSLYTNSQFAMLQSLDSALVTVRSDYVSAGNPLIQCTSLNFPKTEGSPELAVSVAKVTHVHKKSPAQHAADFRKLLKDAQVQAKFTNPITGEPKEVFCLRIDNASDETMVCSEVVYWHVEEHMRMGTKVMLVTSRYAGGSFRNRVELQNGKQCQAHANLFIPSTLLGPWKKVDGKWDMGSVVPNMMAALDVYAARVDGAPFAGGHIKVVKGALGEEAKEVMDMKDVLQQWLKSKAKTEKSAAKEAAALRSKAKKKKSAAKERAAKKSKAKEEQAGVKEMAALKRKYPEQVERIEEVEGVLKRHWVKKDGVGEEFPVKYFFLLRCCYQPGCPHPRCKEGPPQEPMKWWPGGPSLENPLFPSPDESRPRRDNCDECLKRKQVCAGHYLKPLEQWEKRGEVVSRRTPPSQVIEKAFHEAPEDAQELGAEMPADTMCSLMDRCLLPPEELKFHWQHEQESNFNRLDGAKRGAATRKRNRERVLRERIAGGVPSDQTKLSIQKKTGKGPIGKEGGVPGDQASLGNKKGKGPIGKKGNVPGDQASLGKKKGKGPIGKKGDVPGDQARLGKKKGKGPIGKELDPKQGEGAIIQVPECKKRRKGTSAKELDPKPIEGPTTLVSVPETTKSISGRYTGCRVPVTSCGWVRQGTVQVWLPGPALYEVLLDGESTRLYSPLKIASLLGNKIGTGDKYVGVPVWKTFGSVAYAGSVAQWKMGLPPSAECYDVLYEDGERECWTENKVTKQLDGFVAGRGKSVIAKPRFDGNVLGHSQLVGVQIVKDFGGEYFRGVVKAYIMEKKKPIFVVTYEDGDGEKLPPEQLLAEEWQTVPIPAVDVLERCMQRRPVNLTGVLVPIRAVLRGLYPAEAQFSGDVIDCFCRILMHGNSQVLFAPWRVFSTAQHKTMAEEETVRKNPVDSPSGDVKYSHSSQLSSEQCVANAVELLRLALPAHGAWWMGKENTKSSVQGNSKGQGFFMVVPLTGGRYVRRGRGHWVLAHFKIGAAGVPMVEVMDPTGAPPNDEFTFTASKLVSALLPGSAPAHFVNAFGGGRAVHKTGPKKLKLESSAVSHQDDNFSCGVFVCLYAWLLSCGLDASAIARLPVPKVRGSLLVMRRTVLDVVASTLSREE